MLAPGNRLDLDITFGPDDAGKTITVMDRFTRRANHLGTIEVSETVVPTPQFESPAKAKIPAWSDAMDRPIDVDYVLDAARGGKHGIAWRINGETHPDGKHHVLTQGRWNKLRFDNRSGRLHPMHIHGQFFKVIARDGKPVDEPYWRDTVLVRPKESITVGMVPLDEGTWALHCHILEHAEAGMMTMIEVSRK